MQRADIAKHIQSIPHFSNMGERHIMTLISAVCIFISAKYHEQTYPGITQLLEYIRSPFTYDQFVD